MSAALIEARQVTKVLSGIVPVTLVQDINLDIVPSEFVAIIGPSGSGKSSLLYLLGLLDLPTSGDVLIDGRSTTAMTEVERAEVRLTRLGFVFQFHFLLPEFSITENVALPMRALGKLPPRAITARAEELLASFGLGDHRHKTPDQLSGGQRQRVAVARALANGSPCHPRGRADRQPGFRLDRSGVRHPARPGGAARKDRCRRHPRSQSRFANAPPDSYRRWPPATRRPGHAGFSPLTAERR